MSTIETIRNNFRSNDIKFFESPDKPSIVASWRLAGHSVQLNLHVEVEGDFLFMRAGGLFEIPLNHPQYKEIAQLLLALNYEMRFIKASIDPKDGEVIVSGEAWVLGDSLNDESFSQMMSGMLSCTETVIERIDGVLENANPLRHAC